MPPAFVVFTAAVLATEAHFHPRTAAGTNLTHDPGHLVQLPRADHEIDIGGTLENQPLILLRHAAQDANHFARMLASGVLKPAQGAIDLVLCVLTDAARVEQDRVRLADIRRELVTVFAQAGHHELAVELIHLAADGFDIQFHGLKKGNGSRPDLKMPRNLDVLSVPVPSFNTTRYAALRSALLVSRLRRFDPRWALICFCTSATSSSCRCFIIRTSVMMATYPATESNTRSERVIQSMA